jgi:DNA-binding NarL/FixJ family response regulator
MCVRVLVADDSSLMRSGIKQLLKDRGDISVIGEASDLPETIQTRAELLPDVVIIDLRMTASANGKLNPLTIGRPTVAISFAVDETAREQAERLGAVKFIDKMELAKELVPTLLQFAPSSKPS